MTAFFSEPTNKAILLSFNRKLERYISDQGIQKSNPDPAPPLNQLISTITNNTERFDEFCGTSISVIGRKLLDGMSSFDPNLQGADATVREKFIVSYRFLVELEINQGADLSMELTRIRLWVNDNISEFSADDRQSLAWTHYMFPAHLALQLIRSPNVQSFRDFTAAFDAAEKSRTEWINFLSKKKEEVDHLGASLEKYKSTYNFVGLVDAFKSLLEGKRQEKQFAFWCLIGIGCTLLAPLGTQISYLLYHLDGVEKLKSGAILLLPPTVAIELLLFYFFRVVLSHFRTVKAHILQLELRAALCQFIQSYATYASDIKKSDSASLEKFESVVFSGIISSDDKLPTTFDGVEQLAGLVKSIRG